MATGAEQVRPDDLLTIREFATRFPNLGSVGSLRWQIFNADNNGLAAADVIIRRGSRVFIVTPRYLDWLLRRTRGRRAA